MRSSSRSERGSAVVEFALVLPMLLVIALALVQVGLIARDQLMVVQAARAGAREAAVTADADEVRAAAVEAGAGLEPASLEVAVTRAGARGDPVRVGVTYTSPTRTPFVAWLFPPAVSLTATAVLRQEFG